MMKNVSDGQRHLLSDFLANIGVAWFVAGVIGVFINKAMNLTDIVISLSWGLALSVIFLYVAMSLLKGVKI